MNYSQNPIFKKFGLEISNEFFPVKAKVLMPPKLELGGNQVVEPRQVFYIHERKYDHNQQATI
jgi:hypothetical protein